MYQLHEYIPHKVKFDMTLIISTALYTASPFENFLQSDLTPKKDVTQLCDHKINSSLKKVSAYQLSPGANHCLVVGMVVCSWKRVFLLSQGIIPVIYI